MFGPCRPISPAGLLADEPGQQVHNPPPCDTVLKRHNRAIGGLQIVRGDVARRLGYCRDEPRFMQPASRWMRTFEDVRFREILGTQGSPVEVEGLMRIEHHAKGRADGGVLL